MKRRKWDSKTKARIVLEGLSGRSVSELCSEYEISQNQYYLWRDKFLQESHKAFENQEDGREVARLKRKAAKLERIIGSLTVELKKTEDELG
jgi:transposase-like protein